jgi:putative FmdB family regulatory protein
MPLYEYECPFCGHRFELIRRFSDPPAETCTSCGQGPVRKLLSAPAVHFKGTGWYVTDYANRKSDGSPKTDAGAESEGAPSSSPAPATASSPASDNKPSSSGDSKPAGDSKAAEKSGS